jgi:hypothetical protein
MSVIGQREGRLSPKDVKYGFCAAIFRTPEFWRTERELDERAAWSC